MYDEIDRDDLYNAVEGAVTHFTNYGPMIAKPRPAILYDTLTRNIFFDSIPTIGDNFIVLFDLHNAVTSGYYRLISDEDIESEVKSLTDTIYCRLDGKVYYD